MENTSNDVSLYLLMTVALFLVTIDLLEITNLFRAWNYSIVLSDDIFVDCFQWDLIIKTVFSCFSLLAALSSFVLTGILILNSQYIIAKFLTTYLYFNYIIFGPYMFTFCLLAMCNWEKVAFTCDKETMEKSPSTSNIVSIVGCFCFSAFLIIIVILYKALNTYMDSISDHPNGSTLLKKVFWKTVLGYNHYINNTGRQSTNAHNESSIMIET
jgi:hypothetical protein